MPKSTSTAPAPDLDRLAAAASGAAAPVERWNPPECGPIDLAIASDGTWWHNGQPIRRAGLVKLFASVLRRDADGSTWLVTPAEKCRIAVADVAFIAVEMTVSGAGPAQTLGFRTQLDETVIAGPDHPLRFVVEPETGGIRPYIHVRGRLEARVTRALALDLLALAETDEAGRVGLWSAGTFFALPDEALS